MIRTTYVYCDNQGVVKNTSVPKFMLNKNQNSINYHVLREAKADGFLCVGKEYTGTNFADLLTKLVLYSQKIDIL